VKTPLVLLLLALFSAISQALDIVPAAKPSVYGSSEGLKCPIEVRLDQSIGPIHLGMTLEELKKTGLIMKQVRTEDPSYGWYVVGEFSVRALPKQRVTIIEAQLDDLPDCVFFGKQKINRAAGFDELQKVFAACGSLDVRIGGTSSQCRGISVGTGWQDVPGLRLRLDRVDASPSSNAPSK